MSKTLGALREYETVFVINPDLTDEAVNELFERFRSVLARTGGTQLREDKWGKRKMAYDMRKNPRGNYILLHYAAEHQTVRELERTARNADPVIRFHTDLRGPVIDLEAKKAEVEKLVRERSAERARLEQEKAEAGAAAAAASEAAAGEPAPSAQA